MMRFSLRFKYSWLLVVALPLAWLLYADVLRLQHALSSDAPIKGDPNGATWEPELLKTKQRSKELTDALSPEFVQAMLLLQENIPAPNDAAEKRAAGLFRAVEACARDRADLRRFFDALNNLDASAPAKTPAWLGNDLLAKIRRPYTLTRELRKCEEGKVDLTQWGQLLNEYKDNKYREEEFFQTNSAKFEKRRFEGSFKSRRELLDWLKVNLENETPLSERGAGIENLRLYSDRFASLSWATTWSDQELDIRQKLIEFHGHYVATRALRVNGDGLDSTPKEVSRALSLLVQNAKKAELKEFHSVIRELAKKTLMKYLPTNLPLDDRVVIVYSDDEKPVCVRTGIKVIRKGAIISLSKEWSPTEDGYTTEFQFERQAGDEIKTKEVDRIRVFNRMQPTLLSKAASAYNQVKLDQRWKWDLQSLDRLKMRCQDDALEKHFPHVWERVLAVQMVLQAISSVE